MTIYVDRSDRLLRKLESLERSLMAWQDSVNKVVADFTAAANRVNGDLATFGSQVADLKNQVATLTTQLAGTDLPPDAQAALDALDAQINALDVPAPVVPPAPVPAPDQPPAPAPATS